MWWRDKKYVSQAERQALGAKAAQKAAKTGGAMQPVRIEGRAIAKTVWGQAWCQHLENSSEFASRVERGRTYVRNGSVIDLKTKPGMIEATVVGSEVYKLKISVKKLSPAAWAMVKTACAGRIASVVELLQGRVSKEVMTAVADPKHGVMPTKSELHLSCSCPDNAGSGDWICKHIAAVLYGLGARLDTQPELLFALRGVDHLELIDAAATNLAKPVGKTARKTVAASDLADVFGIDLGDAPAAAAKPVAKKAVKKAVKKVATQPVKKAAKKAVEKVVAKPKVRASAAKPAKKPAVAAPRPSLAAAAPTLAKGKQRHR